MMFDNDSEPLEKIALEQESRTIKIPAGCGFYEPMSDISGTCLPEDRIVSRLAGCDDKENCAVYQRTIRKYSKHGNT